MVLDVITYCIKCPLPQTFLSLYFIFRFYQVVVDMVPTKHQDSQPVHIIFVATESGVIRWERVFKGPVVNIFGKYLSWIFLGKTF